MPLDAAARAAFIDPDLPGYVLATIGGQDVPGLFRHRQADAFGLVGGSALSLLVDPAAAAVQEDVVLIDGVSYQVVERRNADGDTPDFTRLVLQEV